MGRIRRKLGLGQGDVLPVGPLGRRQLLCAKFLRRVATLTLLLLAFLAGVAAQTSQSRHEHITLLHVNDIHGFMRPFADKRAHPDLPVGGAAFLAGLINEARAANPDGTLLLSAGDMFQGTAVSNRFYGKPMIDLMNYLSFDASALGNHEFDWGLGKLQEMITAAAFPFLAANLMDSEGQPLAHVKPWAMVERKGVKIALVGVCSTATPRLTLVDNVKTLRFPSPVKTLPPILAEARKAGAGLVVVLSHLGLDEDKELARAVPGIDVIVGGHVHAPLFEPVMVGHTAIVQAGCYGMFLGVLNLRVSSTPGEPPDVETGSTLRRVVAGPNAPCDAAADRLVMGYYNRIAAEFAEEVGETLVELVHPPSGESNVGNMVCDALRERAKAEIAFQNAGGIRAGIPKGKITLEQVMAVYPFENRLVSLVMKGRDIRALFEQMPMGVKASLQVSGIKIVYAQDKQKSPAVKAIMVGDAPLNDERDYKVAINDFLLKGGDGYDIFVKGRSPELGPLVRDVIVDYIRAHSPVKPTVEGRICVE